MSEKLTLHIQGKKTLSLGIDQERGTLGLGVDKAQGTTNYNALANKPSIEGHTLVGNSTLQEIGVGDITAQDIDKLIYG